MYVVFFCFCKHKTAYEVLVIDWSSDFCSSDLAGEIVARTDIYHQSHTSFSEANYQISLKALSPTSRMPAYTLVNGRVEWRDIMESGISLAAFCSNLFDKNYYFGGVDLAPSVGATGAFTGTPRTYGLEASYRSEEHTSELQSLMRISYAVFFLKKKNQQT